MSTNRYGISCTPNLGGVQDYYTKAEINQLFRQRREAELVFLETGHVLVGNLASVQQQYELDPEYYVVDHDTGSVSNLSADRLRTARTLSLTGVVTGTVQSNLATGFTINTTVTAGSITGAMIADGTITDADISATAEIAVSKLADGAARQILQTDAAGTGVEWTSNVDVPGTLDVTGIATFDTKVSIGVAEPTAVREIGWNTDEGTYDIRLDSNVLHRLGADQTTLCRNNSNTVAIPKGTAVMFAGTVGGSGRIKVAPMVADGTYPGYVFFGVTESIVPAGGDGYVKSFGEIRGIDTNAYLEQSILWCDPANPGGFTATEPTAPNLKLAVAAVVSSASNGVLMVRWDTGRRLKDLHDVEANGTTLDGDVLRYNSVAGRWENSSSISISGNLSLATSITFEGATANDFETVLSVVDPTADRAISIPDQSGNLLVSGNASIVNADVSATAEIAVSKLADGASRQLLQTDAAGTGVEWTSNVDIPGTLDVTGAATFDSTAAHPLGSAAAPSVSFTGDPNTGIYSPGADQVAISTNGVGRLFVDASGNVIIDNPSADALLTVRSSYTAGTDADAKLLLDASTGGESDIDFASGSLVNGYIQYRHSTDELIINSADAVDIYTGGGSSLRIADGDAQLYGALGVSSGTAASAAAPSIYFGADPNTGIYSPGADQVALSTGGAERARIDSSGRLLVGTSSARSNFYNFTNVTPRVQIEGVGDGNAASIAGICGDTGGNIAQYIFARHRGAAGAYTVVQADDALGRLSYQGADGNEFVEAAKIEAFVDGTPGANDMPGRLVFSTTADGASSPTERLRISSTGLTTISSTNALGLPVGTTAQRPTGVAGYIRFNSEISEYEGYTGSTWSSIGGGGARGGGNDQVFFENGQVVTTSYTLSIGKNAMTAGPVTINAGVTVTIPSGSTWVIV